MPRGHLQPVYCDQPSRRDRISEDEKIDPVEREKVRVKFGTIEATIAELLSDHENMKNRAPVIWRISWMIQGLLLIRAEQIAERKPQLHDALAEAWISMSDSTMAFSNALEHNQLWSDEEKEAMCFEFRKSGREASAKWIIVHMLPRCLRKNDRASDFAIEKDWLPPSMLST